MTSSFGKLRLRLGRVNAEGAKQVRELESGGAFVEA